MGLRSHTKIDDRAITPDIFKTGPRSGAGQPLGGVA